MTRTMAVVALGLVGFCSLGMAQGVMVLDTPPGDGTPQYTIAVGLGISRYDTPNFKGFGTFGKRVAANTTALTTLDMTSKASVLIEDVAYTFFNKRGVALFALGGLGVATSSGDTGAAFDGGGGIKYQLQRLFKSLPANISAVGTVQIHKLNVADSKGGGVAPGFRGGISVDFN